MGQGQKLFNEAVEHYNHAIELVKMLYQVHWDAERQFSGQTERMDPQQPLIYFDLILQAVLLSLAVSDENFDPLERQYVEKITDYGDLTDYLRWWSRGKTDFTWEQIAAMDTRTQRQLVAMLPDVLDQLCDDFVAPLAKVDSAIRETNFLAQLTEEIYRISSTLGYMDGQVTAAEADASADMIERLLSRRWKQML